ncbi:tripartite tricarboxylate transporter substrate binding protein [Diaphorobacter ruginosibacter]|uniref:Bug family tripartite tricarboxylate transporter substrate binding protein n=1 Tax=Diaphorobacter ruginosibacter TaxID=1715720 RepID=UPI0033428B0C
MKICSRRSALGRLVRWGVAGSAMSAGWAALAQAAYPRQPLKWIVPFPAGGGTDAVARLLGQAMSGALAQPLVVDNRPGAGTMIGGEAIARARPDGHTFGTVDVSTVALAPQLYARVPYRSESDFAFIGGTTRFPFVLVVKPDFPAKDLHGLIAMARGNPGALKYASPGAGGPNHLGMELLQRKLGVSMIHVPYRGDAPALQDLLGGQIDMYLVNTAASLPYLQSGKLRALGVAMKRRIQALPDVPTFAEAGVADFESYAWQGLAAPAGTPPEVIVRLNAELNKALASPEVTARLKDMGVEAMPTTPREFADLVASQAQLWGKVIREAGVKLES